MSISLTSNRRIDPILEMFGRRPFAGSGQVGDYLPPPPDLGFLQQNQPVFIPRTYAAQSAPAMSSEMAYLNFNRDRTQPQHSWNTAGISPQDLQELRAAPGQGNAPTAQELMARGVGEGDAVEYENMRNLSIQEQQKQQQAEAMRQLAMQAAIQKATGGTSGPRRMSSEDVKFLMEEQSKADALREAGLSDEGKMAWIQQNLEKNDPTNTDFPGHAWSKAYEAAMKPNEHERKIAQFLAMTGGDPAVLDALAIGRPAKPQSTEKPLFEKQTGPVLVTSQEQWDALPDGTPVIDETGQKGIKGQQAKR